jgi:hypothetical protein
MVFIFRVLPNSKTLSLQIITKVLNQRPFDMHSFFGEFGRICKSDWVPNEDDILRCRKPTQGVHEIDFNVGRGGVIIR